MQMRVVNTYPPNYAQITAVFDLAGARPVFCWGDTIHNPYNARLDAALIAHEATHARQQGADPAAWWDRYIADPRFRLTQEVEAYRVQLQAHGGTRHTRRAYAAVLADQLASRIYGRVITKEAARRAIWGAV